jgi:hypothetical protein
MFKIEFPNSFNSFIAPLFKDVTPPVSCFLDGIGVTGQKNAPRAIYSKPTFFLTRGNLHTFGGNPSVEVEGGVDFVVVCEEVEDVDVDVIAVVEVVDSNLVIP